MCKLLKISKLCKTWTNENFGITLLGCCNNHTFQRFDLKFWSITDVVLDFGELLTICKLHYGLNMYPSKFGGGHFWGYCAFCLPKLCLQAL